MSSQRRLEPLKRDRAKRTGTWADVQTSHPGVRDPRSVRMNDWPPLVNAAIIATCAFVTALAIFSAALASPVGPVERWSEWSDGGMRLEHPSGWAVRNIGSSEQVHLVIMRSQWVRIHVISETGLSSAAGLYRQLGDGNARYQALEMLHATTGDALERELALGEVEEGRPARTIIGGRRAVWSQFRYAGGVIEGDEPMTGYRATIIGDTRGVIASAVAPSDDWDEFRPVALRVLRSIRFGPTTG